LNLSFSLWRLKFSFSSYLVPNVRVIGIHNLIRETSYRVLFLDYDFMPLSWVIEEVYFLISKFKLGDFIILKSSENSYHAICIDVLTPRRENEIVNCSSCDDAFKNSSSFDFKAKVLRVSQKGMTNKPEFVDFVRSKFNRNNLKSAGHYQFFKLHYSIDDWNVERPLFLSRLDELLSGDKQILYSVSLINYPTRKNVKG